MVKRTHRREYFSWPFVALWICLTVMSALTAAQSSEPMFFRAAFAVVAFGSAVLLPRSIRSAARREPPSWPW